MRFDEIQCSDAVAEELWTKHHVDLVEVEEALTDSQHIRRGRDGLYYVFGRSEGGRNLFVVLRDLGGGVGRLVTARDMTQAERRLWRNR